MSGDNYGAELEPHEAWSEFDEGSLTIPLDEMEAGGSYRIYDPEGVWMDGKFRREEKGRLHFATSRFCWDIGKEYVQEAIPIEREWEV